MTADWPRYGVKGAAAHLRGRGDFCNMFVLELPAGSSTLPQRHLYEEIYYVLEGRGSTQLEFVDGRRRSLAPPHQRPARADRHHDDRRTREDVSGLACDRLDGRSAYAS